MMPHHRVSENTTKVMGYTREWHRKEQPGVQGMPVFFSFYLFYLHGSFFRHNDARRRVPLLIVNLSFDNIQLSANTPFEGNDKQARGQAYKVCLQCFFIFIFD
jgi:hypothetical protein